MWIFATCHTAVSFILIYRYHEKNLTSIDEAHDSLNALRDSIVKSSDDFVNEVNNLLKSLDETREKITQNTTTSEKAKEQFDTVYESIVNN